jgi:hypothetical protein
VKAGALRRLLLRFCHPAECHEAARTLLDASAEGRVPRADRPPGLDRVGVLAKRAGRAGEDQRGPLVPGIAVRHGARQAHGRLKLLLGEVDTSRNLSP